MNKSTTHSSQPNATKGICFLLATLSLVFSQLTTFAYPPRIWHTMSGQSVTGSFEKVVSSTVHLRVNGRPIQVAISKLTPEDRTAALIEQYVVRDSSDEPIGIKCDAPQNALESYYSWRVNEAELTGKHVFRIAPMGKGCSLPSIPSSSWDIGFLNAALYDEIKSPEIRWFRLTRRGEIKQMENGNYETRFWDESYHDIAAYFSDDVFAEMYALPESTLSNGHGTWVYFVKGKIGIVKNKYGNDSKGILIGNLQSSKPNVIVPNDIRERLEAMTADNWESIRDELLSQ